MEEARLRILGRTTLSTSARTPIDVLTNPFTRFAKLEASGGIVLLAATVLALIWANSPWEHSYHALWEKEVTAGFGRTVLTWSRHLWVNDGLMSIFFFVVGLEIKRELLIGELSSFQQAAFPFLAALSGCLLPDSTEAHAALHAMEEQCALMESPLHRIEHALQPWVSFVIMPLFAFSNAGVHVLGKLAVAVKNPVTLGVALGLLVGKPFGITAFAWAAEKVRLASRPAGVNWTQIFAASWVCGIGFTMSLFIATLVFPEGDPLDLAKIGTLAASIAAGGFGSFLLLRSQKAESAIAEAGPQAG